MDIEPEDVTTAWHQAQADLPDGWQLDGLRCASGGLTADLRSDDWVAAATAPTGEERIYRAADPFAALAGIVSDTLTEAVGQGPHGGHSSAFLGAVD